MAAPKKPNIDELFRRMTEIDAAVREAARQAVLRHKVAGNPIADWQDGRVVLVQPNDIVVPDAPRPAGEQNAA